MKKQINLISFYEAYKHLTQESFKKYLKSMGIDSMKPHEINTLIALIEDVNYYEKGRNYKLNAMECFFIDFSIPQISKQFDLLKYDDSKIINIELKSEYEEDKLIQQQIQNYYYLEAEFDDIHIYTYVLENRKLYRVIGGKIYEYQIRDLFSILMDCNNNENDIDALFKPTKYLISPLNDTEKFINDKYFLNDKQDEIKNKLFKSIQEITTNGHKFYAISAAAGTGKTMLLYDIAMQYIRSSKHVLIFHTGKLNSGHQYLIDNYDWTIFMPRDLSEVNFTEYDLILVDESQRLNTSQLDHFLEKTRSSNQTCIFAYDHNQTLSLVEKNDKIPKKIEALHDMIEIFTLESKVRTNFQIASFIKGILDKSKVKRSINYRDVNLKFFNSLEYLKAYLRLMHLQNCTVINYTPLKKGWMPYYDYMVINAPSTHDVIGQEFDHVVVVVDENFYYEGNRLKTRGYDKKPYYHPTKMLLQQLSRTKNKLTIIFYRNEEVFNHCLNFVKYNK